MIYCFDIDGTICTNTWGAYEKAQPFPDRIRVINELFQKGNKIKLFTARGSTTGVDWRPLTEQQLSSWEVNYHELVLGKPEADVFIDDKAFNSDHWHWSVNDLSLSSDPYNVSNTIDDALNVHRLLLTDKTINQRLTTLIDWCIRALHQGGKIFLAGNGGSFSDAQHLAAEFSSRLRFDRSPLPAIALGTNSSSMSAIANDYGYDQIFSRELISLATPQDVFIPITTSGNSKNVLAAVKTAQDLSLPIMGFTGWDGGDLAKQCSCLQVPSNRTERIQECHILLGHILCEAVESTYFQRSLVDALKG